MAAATSITVQFEKEHETKRTVRFAEVVPEGTDPKIGTLYVKKSALHHIGNPETLEVIIKAPK